MTNNRTIDLITIAAAAAAFVACSGIAIYHEVDPNFNMGWVPRIIETLLIPTSLLLILLALIMDNNRMRDLAGTFALVSAIFSIGFIWNVAVGGRITAYSDSHWTEPLALIIHAGYLVLYVLHAKRTEAANS